MRFYILAPEVGGGFGPNTDLDSTCHPPKVGRVHYLFDGWLGDCLVESFPCFVATESVIAELKEMEISGMNDSDVEISTSERFRELYPNVDIGRWRWLRAVGIPGEDDIAITASARLVASERAVAILRRHGLAHCELEEYHREDDERGWNSPADY
jgi:hypothetical protein